MFSQHRRQAARIAPLDENACLCRNCSSSVQVGVIVQFSFSAVVSFPTQRGAGPGCGFRGTPGPFLSFQSGPWKLTSAGRRSPAFLVDAEQWEWRHVTGGDEAVARCFRWTRLPVGPGPVMPQPALGRAEVSLPEPPHKHSPAADRAGE